MGLLEDLLEDERASAFVWCCGALHELHAMRLISGTGKYTVGVSGMAIWDQLDASGYRPTDPQIQSVLLDICPGITDPEQIGVMLREFRDNRARIHKFIEKCEKGGAT